MEPIKESFDNYGSHLYVFEKIFSFYNVEKILEFGMGNYSTKYFINRSKLLFSVEQESTNWYDKIVSENKSPKWNPIMKFDPRAVFEHFDEQGIRFDLIFSDGAPTTRSMVANMAMERNVPLVVLHDAEKVWYYGWNNLRIPEGYSRIDFCCRKGSRKVTSVITNCGTFQIKKWNVPEHDRVVIRFSKPDQPVHLFAYPEVGIMPSFRKKSAFMV